MSNYVLVPREATKEMVDAARNTWIQNRTWQHGIVPAWRKIFEAACDARPSHYDDLLKAMEEVCKCAANVCNGVYFYEHGNREKELTNALACLSAAREKTKAE